MSNDIMPKTRQPSLTEKGGAASMCVEIEVLIGSLKRARRRGMLELSPRLPQTSRCNVAKIVSLRLTPSVHQVLVMTGWNIPPHIQRVCFSCATEYFTISFSKPWKHIFIDCAYMWHSRFGVHYRLPAVLADKFMIRSASARFNTFAIQTASQEV